MVYKAIDLKAARTQRTVALKFLPAELGVDEKEKAKSLVREDKAASALDHANIGLFHGLEETTDGRLFIVMGYYEGENRSRTRFGAFGPIPLQESLDVACQIACAGSM